MGSSAVRKTAFVHLLQSQQTHSKYRDVTHKSLKMQAYMCDKTMRQDNASLLFAMRTKTVRNIRNDFGKMYNSDLRQLCHRHVDTIHGV